MSDVKDENDRDEGKREREPGENLPDVPRIALRAPSGVIIDHTLPLHESIADQWRKGELQRVDGDGNPWSDGDEYDLSGAYGSREAVPAADEEAGFVPRDEGEAGLGEGTGEPVRPDGNAPKRAWQDYAVAVGAVPEDEAPRLSRQQLIDRSTPPELRPEA